MPTTVNLAVLGLCIVLDPQEGTQTVVSVQTAVRRIPKHETFLGLTGIDDFDGVPPIDISIQYPPKDESKVERKPPLVPPEMRFMKVPDRAWIQLPAPASRSRLDGDPFRPASIADLGLGGLRDGVGSGDWLCGEGARLVLPTEKADFGWRDRVGEFRFPAVSTEFRDVADLYRWSGQYDDECRISFRFENDARGHVDLSGQAEIRFLSFSQEEVGGSAIPFDFIGALADMRLTKRRTLRRPQLKNGTVLEHPESGSCPPIQGP